MDPDPHGSGTLKIQSWIRIRNKSFRIHNTAKYHTYLLCRALKHFLVPFHYVKIKIWRKKIITVPYWVYRTNNYRINRSWHTVGIFSLKGLILLPVGIGMFIFIILGQCTNTVEASLIWCAVNKNLRTNQCFGSG